MVMRTIAAGTSVYIYTRRSHRTIGDCVGHTSEFWEVFQKTIWVEKKPDRFFKDHRRPWLPITAAAAAEDANDLQTMRYDR